MSRQRKHPNTVVALKMNPRFDTCPYCAEWVDTRSWDTDDWMLIED